MSLKQSNRPWPIIGPSKLVSKRARRALLTKYAPVPVSQKIAEVLKLGRNPDVAQREVKLQFLKNNMLSFVSALAEFAVGQRIDREKVVGVLDNPHTISQDQLNNYTRMCATRIVTVETERFQKQFASHFIKYLKERGIDYEKKAFSMAMDTIISGKTLLDLARVSPIEFEKAYVGGLKVVRGLELGLGRSINKVIEKAFKGKKLTPMQKKAVVRWMNGHLNEFEQVKATILRVSTDANSYKKLMDEAEEIIFKKIYADLAPSFFAKQREARVPLESRVQKKLGDRVKRMMQYSRSERIADAARRDSFERVEEYAKKVNKSFNPVDYCLTELTKENHSAGAQFRQLVNSKLLNSMSLRGLFSKGSLTQKIFLKALQEHKFTSDFGEQNINALARGLAYIGPTGKKIGHAIRAFQSPQATRIFEFLEKNGLIETSHGGGNVVYLKRT